jgi:hypothetical protein
VGGDEGCSAQHTPQFQWRYSRFAWPYRCSLERLTHPWWMSRRTPENPRNHLMGLLITLKSRPLTAGVGGGGGEGDGVGDKL